MLLLMSACSGGDSDREAVGFQLPVPTVTPWPSVTPITERQRAELCPNLPGNVELIPGDEVNLYEAFELESATDVAVVHDDIEWLIGNSVAELLRTLDQDVELQSGTFSRPLLLLAVNYPRPGHEQCQRGPASVEMMISQDASLVRFPGFDTALAPLPAGFAEAVLNAALPVTPTFEPFPTATPQAPRPTRTPVVIPENAPFFNHPEDEELRWDGPDDRVYSRARAHCQADREVMEGYGIPGFIGVEDEAGFWATGPVMPPPGLRWTGYQHDGWEIWQGADPLVIYLVHPDLPAIAFAYRSFSCI